MQRYDQLFINGAWVPSRGDGSLEVINAATEEVMGTIPAGCAADVAVAVAAARAAFPGWAATPVAQRAGLLQKLAQGLAAQGEAIARTITGEVGMPLKLSQRIQAGLPAAVLESYATLVETYPFEEELGNSLVIREPVGVVGCITPWNYPLHQAVAKLAPALAAGCTVVLKPSELAPLSAFLLAGIAEEIGLPPGVFNLVSGSGAEVGEALAAHPGVEMVSFTGSTRAGRRVAELAAKAVKRVALELGGKSASVVLDDADLAAAVKGTVNGCFLNSGQTCTALTRLLVPESRYAEAARLAVEIARGFTVGDPLAGQARLGPLVSAAQRERVRGYIRQGLADGAELLLGGRRAAGGAGAGLLRAADGVRPGRSAIDPRPGGDLRPGPLHPQLPGRGGGGGDRQRFDLRAGRRGLVGGPRARPARRPADPGRTDRHQRRALQSPRPLRRLQAVGVWPGTGQVRAGGVFGGQVAAALNGRYGGRQLCGGS